MVDVLRSDASDGSLVWQVLGSECDDCFWGMVAGEGGLRNSIWSRGLKVTMVVVSLTERLRRPRAFRLRIAALPSANINCASGVEQPRASTIGNELLLCLCVLGRGLSSLAEGEECWFSILSQASESVLVDHGHGNCGQKDKNWTRVLEESGLAWQEGRG